MERYKADIEEYLQTYGIEWAEVEDALQDIYEYCKENIPLKTKAQMKQVFMCVCSCLADDIYRGRIVDDISELYDELQKVAEIWQFLNASKKAYLKNASSTLEIEDLQYWKKLIENHFAKLYLNSPMDDTLCDDSLITDYDNLSDEDKVVCGLKVYGHKSAKCFFTKKSHIGAIVLSWKKVLEEVGVMDILSITELHLLLGEMARVSGELKRYGAEDQWNKATTNKQKADYVKNWMKAYYNAYHKTFEHQRQLKKGRS